MYSFKVTDDIIKQLNAACIVAPSIHNRLTDLSTNPLAKAVATNIPLFGDFYVNAGRYCIVFNIDNKNQRIEILAVVLSPFLNKILTGQLPPPALKTGK